MNEKSNELRVTDVITAQKEEIERLQSLATEERNRRQRLARERDTLRSFLLNLKQRLDNAPQSADSSMQTFLDAIRAELSAAWIKADKER